MKILFFLFFIAWIPCKVSSQTSGNFTSTVSIQAVMQISVTNTAYSMLFDTPGEYDNESVITNFNTIKIKTNQPWSLSFSSTSSTFTASGTFSTPNMPASLCKIGVTGQSSTLSLSTTSQLLSTGNRGNEAATGNTFDITLKINPGYTYGAGIYNLGIVYTLTAR